MSSFDVRVFAIRRRPGRAVFEVRWRVAGRDRCLSFMTRALADSYRAELVRAPRRGVAFVPETGEPAAWARPEPVTWYRHAVVYADMKWPHPASHSRASLADALATVTPLLTRETGRRPPGSTLRAALYGHAFNPRQRRCHALDPVTAASGRNWPRSSGCLYYAALRPEEAVALRRGDLILPVHGRGKLILTAACPRTGSAWPGTGTPHDRAVSSTAPTARSASSPSRPCWSACSAATSTSTAARRTADCSAAPAAACSASRYTAASGTPPARPLSARSWPPPRSPAAHMTCGIPPCPCGRTPAQSPPRSPHGPAIAPASCTTCTSTASTARKISSASGSRTPSVQTPAAGSRHRAGKQAVTRTVGTTQDPVRYMYADLPAGPPAAHELLPQQTCRVP